MKNVIEKEVVEEVIDQLCTNFAAELIHFKQIVIHHQEHLPEKQREILLNSLKSYSIIAKNVHEYSKSIQILLHDNVDRFEILYLCHKILNSIQFFKDDLASLSIYLQTGKYPELEKTTLH